MMKKKLTNYKFLSWHKYRKFENSASTLHVIHFRFYLTKLDRNLSSVNSYFKVSIYVLINEKGNFSIYKDKDTAKQ